MFAPFGFSEILSTVVQFVRYALAFETAIEIEL